MLAARIRHRRARQRKRLVDLAAALSVTGSTMQYVGLAFVVPAIAAIVYDEAIWPYAASAAIAIAAGLALQWVTGETEEVGLREGFLVVALTWLAVAAVGALPYVFVGHPQLDSPTDAYFEAMAGFTTTGASVLTDIEAMPKALLLWRSLTQWLGGMGIVVLALAVLPRLAVGGQQLMQHEVPGYELEKLSPTIRETARRLWLLYIALSGVQLAILLAAMAVGAAADLDFYNALALVFSTMSAGGFSPQQESVAAFDALVQVVVMVFMLLAGTNFALMYRAAQGRPGRLLRNEEFRLYLSVIAVGSVIVGIELLGTQEYGVGETARHATFQAISVVTGTGFASVDFAEWAPLAVTTLLVLMFFGGMTGSTTGSIKMLRHLLVARMIRREIELTAHPAAVVPVRLNGRVVDEHALRAVLVFVLVFVSAFLIGTVLLLLDGTRTGTTLSPVEAISAAAATLGNIGPGIGFLGPAGSYAPFSDASKLLMVVLMWIGRLEILPVLVLFTRTYWRP